MTISASTTVSEYAKKAYNVIVNGVVLGEETWLSRKIEMGLGRYMSPQSAKMTLVFLECLPLILLHVACMVFTPPLPLLGLTLIFILRPITFCVFSKDENKTNRGSNLMVSNMSVNYTILVINMISELMVSTSSVALRIIRISLLIIGASTVINISFKSIGILSSSLS